VHHVPFFLVSVPGRCLLMLILLLRYNSLSFGDHGHLYHDHQRNASMGKMPVRCYMDSTRKGLFGVFEVFEFDRGTDPPADEA